MAAINFPDSPSNGDTHTVGGVTYTYNSAETKWKTTINSNAFLPLTGGTVSGNLTTTGDVVLGGELQHSGDTDTKITFGTDTINFDTAGSTRATVDSSGRLLVGTSTARSNFNNSNATAQLQVEGTNFNNSSIALIRNSADVNAGSLMLAKSRSASVGGNTVVQSSDILGQILFEGNDGSEFVVGANIRAVVDGTPGANDMPTRLVFETTSDGASGTTERMRITSGGDILAGSSSTWGTDNGSSFYIHNNSDQQTLKVSSGDPGSAPYGLIGFYRNKGSLIARITTDGSSVSYNTSSDYRLKENVVDLNNAIERVKQLAPKRFNWIADETATTVDGFLAHEAQLVVPEAVVGEKDAVDDEGNPVYQGIDQSKLVPLLTAALQEAISKIETLETRVAQLEGGTP